MGKDFKSWHFQKENINNKNKTIFFKEREVWFCHLGLNIGTEQDGVGKQFLRPVLIIKRFNKRSALIIPLTRSNKIGSYYLELDSPNSFAILSQIRYIDSKRLKYLINSISEKKFNQIKNKLNQIIN